MNNPNFQPGKNLEIGLPAIVNIEMEKETTDIDQLKLENERLRAEVAALKEQLKRSQSGLDPRKVEESVYKCPPFPTLEPLHERNLTNEEIARYGRQLILNEIGIEGRIITEFRIILFSL